MKMLTLKSGAAFEKWLKKYQNKEFESEFDSANFCLKTAIRVRE